MTIPTPDDTTDDTAGDRGDAGQARLEIRLHPTQATLLDGMARRLTKERRRAGRTGRRLNKSALIRAAVTVLTDARGAIHGTTEAEIADSLRRWLATDPNGDPLPRQTRDALREARRQLASLERQLDRAANPAPNTGEPAAVQASGPPGAPELTIPGDSAAWQQKRPESPQGASQGV